MPVSLNEPDDLTLINLERVAVKGEKIRFGETAIRTISASNSREILITEVCEMCASIGLLDIKLAVNGSNLTFD
tara:strand:- start:44 stop:265 length:222 start_codon:yes stop_codon:yes gene_type:complete